MLAGMLAILALVAHAGRFHWWFDLPSHFAPFYLAVGAFTAALLPAQPRRLRLPSGMLSVVAIAASGAPAARAARVQPAEVLRQE
mgnify:CR=1 FL=1